MTRKTIIIGDIHGCLNEFKQLLNLCDFKPNYDRLICSGDLIDRGPHSAGVVNLLMKLGGEMVIGNHEEKYIRYRYQDRLEKRKRIYDPRHPASNKVKTWFSLTYEQLDWIEKQPYYLFVEEYNAYVVHAGILPELPIDCQEKETYLYTRYVHKDTHQKLHLVPPTFCQAPNSIHWTELYKDRFDIIFGHHVRSLLEPTILMNKNGGRTIGLDTGAVFGGKLTAIVYSKKFPKGEIKQIDTKSSKL